MSGRMCRVIFLPTLSLSMNKKVFGVDLKQLLYLWEGVFTVPWLSLELAVAS